MASKRLSKKSESITAKTDSARLKRSIDRRRRIKNVTHLFDHSVPTSLLFKGVLRRQTNKILTISHPKTHTLSPFVIHLKEPLPSPDEILAQEEMKPILLNLLVPEEHLISIDDIVKDSNPLDDLVLETSEVSGQLTEDVILELPRIRWSLPRLSMPVLKRSATGDLSFVQPSFSRMSLDSFVPPNPPSDMISYFDLPEFDEDKYAIDPALEAKLDLSFDDEDDLKSDLDSKKRLRLPSFSFPKLSIPSIQLPGKFHLAHGWHRGLGAFVLLSFVFVLPMHAMNVVNDLRDTQDQVEHSGRAALSALEAGANAALVRDASSAADSFSRASDQFSLANDRINELGIGTTFILSTFPTTQKNYRAGKNLLAAGEALSIAGERISEGLLALSVELDPTPTSRIKILSAYAESAIPYLETAEEKFDRVKLNSVPEEQQSALADLQNKLPILIASLHEFVDFSEMASVILGDKGTKRYLIIFQNNTEIRPTGGFMGSFAELSITNGTITNMSVPGGGTYDLQGNLSTYTIAPKPLQLLKARWEFQDANWFVDFPTSARQILDFYSDAGGPTMDGVIAVNATYIAELLELLGPIDMPEYGRTIDAENFVFETQKIVEFEYDKEENRPKGFIGDLAPIMLDRAMEKSEEDFLSLLDRFNQGLVERDIQFYFTQDAIQKQIVSLGWGGNVKWTTGDYFMVVDSNLGGGKTDGVIEQDIELIVNIDEMGVITNTATITRTHHGIRGTTFTGVNNVDYIRLYVPKGSELIDATGFSIPDTSLFEIPLDGWSIDDDLLYIAESEEIDPASGTQIYEESGKTVFGNWVQTKPGTNSVATFTYRLPFTIDALQESRGFLKLVKNIIGIPTTEQYSLTVQKQSGILDRTTRVNLELPDSLDVLWASHDPEGMSFTNQTDAFFAALFEPNRN